MPFMREWLYMLPNIYMASTVIWKAGLDHKCNTDLASQEPDLDSIAGDT